MDAYLGYKPTFKKTVLSNGVRVLTESHPFSRSVCAGIFVNSGTRDEPEGMMGAAHLIEHLVFKGTKSRSAYDIAKSLEEVGGDLNAYTSREYTCFHAVSLREHLNLSLDVLVDLVTEAEFSATDYEKERQVIIQEIDMSADQLEDYVFDLFFEGAFKNHPLGNPILGTAKSLKGISRGKIIKYYRERYRGKALVVSVAGPVEHQEVVDQVAKKLESGGAAGFRHHRRTPKLNVFKKMIKRPAEQAHVLIGFPSSTFCEELRFDAFVLNGILGGGTTSQLYQIIREKKGLAYSVYSSNHAFVDAGYLLIYAGTSRESVSQTLDIVRREVDKLRKKGVPADVLEIFKTQFKGQILLGADDMENRMNSLGVNEMVFGRYRSVESVIADVDRVSEESIGLYINSYLDPKKASVLVLGDVMTKRIEKSVAAFTD